MATSSQYGVTNPGGLDPFPIEQTLAQIVGTNNPAAARDMLNTYQLKNMVSQDNYGYDLNQQHEYAKQQMAATLAENQLKAAMEGVKTPGGLSVASAMDPAIAARLQGITGPIETNLRRAQDATTAEHGASAGYHAVQAGYPLPLGEFQRITGTDATQGVPLQLQIARENNAASAGAHAAKDKMVQMPVKYGEDGAGNPLFYNVPVPLHSTPEQVEALRQQALTLGNSFYPQGSGLKGAVGTSGKVDEPSTVRPPPRTARPDTAPTPSTTNLTPAPQQPTTKPASTGAAPAANAPAIRDPRAQKLAGAGLNQLPLKQRMDVMNNMGPTGAEIPLAAKPGGGMVYVGKTGQYPVPGS